MGMPGIHTPPNFTSRGLFDNENFPDTGGLGEITVWYDVDAEGGLVHSVVIDSVSLGVSQSIDEFTLILWPYGYESVLSQYHNAVFAVKRAGVTGDD